jgi:hypothetical protein
MTSNVAETAKIMIAKVRRHIEHDHCKCCKAALSSEEVLNND